jgi:hypothetical protein
VIVRRRSCASVLVAPRRKMTFVRALHGRAAMAGFGAPWPIMGELAGEGREGEGERWVRLGGARGAVGGGLGPGCSVLSPCS